MTGLTGKIKFDQHGIRSDFVLEIVELKKDGLIKVGEWNEKSGVNFTRNFTESYTEIVESRYSNFSNISNLGKTKYTTTNYWSKVQI